MSTRLPQQHIGPDGAPISTPISGTSPIYKNYHHAATSSGKEDAERNADHVFQTVYDEVAAPEPNKRGLALLMIVVALALSMFLVS